MGKHSTTPVARTPAAGPYRLGPVDDGTPETETERLRVNRRTRAHFSPSPPQPLCRSTSRRPTVSTTPCPLDTTSVHSPPRRTRYEPSSTLRPHTHPPSRETVCPKPLGKRLPSLLNSEVTLTTVGPQSQLLDPALQRVGSPLNSVHFHHAPNTPQPRTHTETRKPISTPRGHSRHHLVQTLGGNEDPLPSLLTTCTPYWDQRTVRQILVPEN